MSKVSSPNIYLCQRSMNRAVDSGPLDTEKLHLKSKTSPRNPILRHCNDWAKYCQYAKWPDNEKAHQGIRFGITKVCDSCPLLPSQAPTGTPSKWTIIGLQWMKTTLYCEVEAYSEKFTWQQGWHSQAHRGRSTGCKRWRRGQGAA